MIYLLLIGLASILMICLIDGSKIYSLFIFPLLFMICLVSKDIPDMENYGDYYNAIGSGDRNTFLGYGWLLLCIIGNKYQLSYVAFKSILYLITCGLVYQTIGKIVADSKEKNLVFVIYLIFPGLLDLIQIRFFLASTIILYNLVVFLKKQNIKNGIKYVIATAIAFTIHSSSIFCLVFLFIPLLKYMKLKTIFITVCIASFGFIIVSPAIKDVLIAVLPDYQADRINSYFSSGHIKLIALVIYSSLFFLQYLLSYIMYRSNVLDDEDKKLMRDVCILNTLLLLSIPLVYISSDFLRLQRPYLLLNTALIIKNYKSSKSIKIELASIYTRYSSLYAITIVAYVILFIFAFNYKAVMALLNF